MKYDIIIAIDPDTEKSGVATLDLDGMEVHAEAMPFPVLLDELSNTQCLSRGKNIKVIVEGGWLVSAHWHLKAGDNKKTAAAKGNSTGRNHETGRKIVEMLAYWGIEHEVIHPLKKCWKGRDGKITLAELNSLLRGMGIREMGRCNQDVRDAVLIALTCSGLPMRMR